MVLSEGPPVQRSVVGSCIHELKRSHVLLSEWMSGTGSEMPFDQFFDMMPYSKDFVLDGRLRSSFGHVASEIILKD